MAKSNSVSGGIPFAFSRESAHLCAWQDRCIFPTHLNVSTLSIRRTTLRALEFRPNAWFCLKRVSLSIGRSITWCGIILTDTHKGPLNIKAHADPVDRRGCDDPGELPDKGISVSSRRNLPGGRCIRRRSSQLVAARLCRAGKVPYYSRRLGGSSQLVIDLYQNRIRCDTAGAICPAGLSGNTIRGS